MESDKVPPDPGDVTRDQAAATALTRMQEYVASLVRVAKVVTRDEITGSIPRLYTSPEVRMEDCWFVYFEEDSCAGLRSSTIMLISRTTGETMYVGSANDEG